MSFDTALQFVLGYEGGFSDHPDDPGGKTNLGITQRALDEARAKHPDWGMPADVRAIKRAHAAKIYRAEYWDAVHGDDLPPAVAFLAFDCAVNQGPRRAIRLLQEAVDVPADGIIGPRTLAAVREASLPTLIREYALGRALAYIATGRVAIFGKGWFRRLFGAVVEAVRLSR